jgi:predicted phage terminase large subunit-like protein
MGSPLPRGGALFRDVYFYGALPERMKVAIGVDLAYSTKSKSDYSVAVVLGEHEGRYYLLDVVRVQLAAPDFRVRLAALTAKYRVTPSAYVSGLEKGVLDMFGDFGTHVRARPAIYDKFTRAQPVAAAWNAGKVLLPRNAPWLDPLVTELLAFTGVKDRKDDQVDALAAAFDSVFVSDLRRTQASNAFRPLASGFQNLGGWRNDHVPTLPAPIPRGEVHGLPGDYKSWQYRSQPQTSPSVPTNMPSTPVGAPTTAPAHYPSAPVGIPHGGGGRGYGNGGGTW